MSGQLRQAFIWLYRGQQYELLVALSTLLQAQCMKQLLQVLTAVLAGPLEHRCCNQTLQHPRPYLCRAPEAAAGADSGLVLSSFVSLLCCATHSSDPDSKAQQLTLLPPRHHAPVLSPACG